MIDARALYLDLLKKCLTHYLWEKEDLDIDPTIPRPFPKNLVYKAMAKSLARLDVKLMKAVPFQAELRVDGRDWPSRADTMIGLKRLDNIQQCLESVIRDNVPGDVIETGVWRGGATIFMRAVLKVYEVTDRVVWVADSFEGLPPPDPARYQADAEDSHHKFARLRVSLEEVKANFAKYELLDDQVRFLKGWFKDTLSTAPISQLAVIRLDGDMYESTMDGLTWLYPKLSAGGYMIIDDYALPACRQAVTDFRAANGIRDEIKVIDWTGVYWRRETADQSLPSAERRYQSVAR